MPFFPFSTSEPATNTDPKDSQPILKNNNISLNGLINVDHYSFNVGFGGYHKQLSFIAQSGATLPPEAPVGGSGVLFGKQINGDTWPHWKNASGSAIPLISGAPSLTAPGGYTYLAGNLLMQWGISTPGATGDNTVNFSPAFVTAPYTVLLQPLTADSISSSSRLLIVTSAINTTNFHYNLQTNLTVSNLRIYWLAIGLAS